MSLQDAIAIFTFALAIAGVVFALGKQSQSIATNTSDINNVGKKLDNHIERADSRMDDVSKFAVRVDQRTANLERQVYGEQITEILRSGVPFHGEEDNN